VLSQGRPAGGAGRISKFRIRGRKVY
jgi:hypothetical protein